VRIGTDWTTAPPVELWRTPVGPGWSSFAVDGDRVYTQEQRGDHELVSAYRLSTGRPIWRHRDATRFWESNGGAGPRATPTLSGGRIYAFGATGILNALDASTGARIWSRNVATDAGKVVPMWGFSSSPLVFDDLVVVAAAGKLAAYDRATGKPKWFGPNGGGYSSPQLLTMNGVDQIVFMNSSGTISMNPADGKVLWEHPWEGTPIVQPAKLDGGDLLISSADMMGGMAMRRLGISQQGAAWTVQERWTSRGLKPYFNDFVVHKGHAYGFDGSILSCIELETGERKWKGGRYGQGQFVLLADQDLLVVLSEDGDVALVSATPDDHRELAKMKAVEGKTWNHPVVVRDILLVRNGEEMAAFRLPLAAR
jgi:outer membrane protein assembly factor BamB